MFDTDNIVQSSAKKGQDERYFRNLPTLMRGKFIRIDISETPYQGVVQLENGAIIHNVIVAQPRGGHKETDTWLPRIRTIDQETKKVIEEGEWVYILFVQPNYSSPVAIASEGSVYYEGDKIGHVQERRVRRVKTHIDGEEVIEDAIIEYIETEIGEITVNVTAQEKGTGNITINLTGVDDNNGKFTANISGAVEVNVQGEVEFNFSKSFVAKIAQRIVFKNSNMLFGGEDADQQLVLGNILLQKLNSMIQWILAHTHTGNLGAPTSPPLPPPLQLLDLSILSDIARTKKGSDA